MDPGFVAILGLTVPDPSSTPEVTDIDEGWDDLDLPPEKPAVTAAPSTGRPPLLSWTWNWFGTAARFGVTASVSRQPERSMVCFTLWEARGYLRPTSLNVAQARSLSLSAASD